MKHFLCGLLMVVGNLLLLPLCLAIICIIVICNIYKMIKRTLFDIKDFITESLDTQVRMIYGEDIDDVDC